MKTASSKIFGAKISLKHSLALCKELRGKKVDKARKFLEDLIARKRTVNHKYYPKAAGKFLELINTVEANARQKNLNTEKLCIRKIEVGKGVAFYRPRSLWHLRGQRSKSVNLTIEVGEG
jgi:large subunit ribosomal protein L22